MDTPTKYEPPKVWKWDEDSGGTWSKINRPISGATHERELPIGDHPLQLHSLGTPNGQKVTILLEELLEAGVQDAEYDAFYVNIGEGEQFGSGFVAANPNSKIPALIDRSGAEPVRVFESGSILLYLAEKFGKFIPEDPVERTEMLNWLFWQMGSAPYLGGGFGHFYKYAPEKFEYAINRFTMEAKRQLDVLDKRLGETRYIAGDSYTIADIALWPWYGGVALGLVYDAAEFLDTASYTNLIRWAEEIQSRPAVQRGRRVNRVSDTDKTFLRERHSAADFDEPLAETPNAAE